MRNRTNKIIRAYAQELVKHNISNQIASVAVRTVCSSFYGYKYYPKKEEKIEKDPLILTKLVPMRNRTNKIKTIYAEDSVKSNISNQKVFVAVQTVCSSFYGYKYYLKKDKKLIHSAESSKTFQVKGTLKCCLNYQIMKSVLIRVAQSKNF